MPNRVEASGPRAENHGMISFVIPAHNEERLLARTLASLHAAAGACGEPFEIIVVDDCSTDRTAAIAAEHGARLVRVVNRQISATRNSGAREARGRFIVFVDADTLVDAAVVGAALNALRAGAVGGGCHVRFDGRLPAWARVAELVLHALQRSARLAAGCFLFCTRDAFEDAGGFDESIYAGEEVVLSRALQRQGRFVILREGVLTSGRKLRSHSSGDILGFAALVATRGMGAVRSREGLDVWYGPRRDDADPEQRTRAA